MKEHRMQIGVFEAIEVGERLYYGYDVVFNGSLISRRVGFENQKGAENAALEEENRLEELLELEMVPGTVEIQ